MHKHLFFPLITRKRFISNFYNDNSKKVLFIGRKILLVNVYFPFNNEENAFMPSDHT